MTTPIGAWISLPGWRPARTSGTSARPAQGGHEDGREPLERAALDRLLERDALYLPEMLVGWRCRKG